MFEQLFEDPVSLGRQRNGPLAEERQRFLVHCAEQCMAPSTLLDIAYCLLHVATALRLAERPGEFITRDEIKTAADRWTGGHAHQPTPRAVSSTWRRFIRYATRWLSFLDRLQPLAPVFQPHADLVAKFADYMRQERGLSPQTIAGRCRAANELLDQLPQAGLRLDTLTAAQVDDLLARMVREGGYARVSVRAFAYCLRAFFRFAEACARCRPGLATAVTAPRVYRDETIPAGPSWGDVRRLLTTAQGDQPTDLRARAVLLLLATYGLRAGEVVGLRLEDFDWERELLTVAHGKRQRPRTYPLCRAVGEAVLRYLREARPRSVRREVFLNLRAPFGPLSCAGVGYVVRPRLRALGVTLPHYGPHALRHACATHLLAQGLSLKEIGDHLGHQSPESTRRYAKVDLAGLRAVGEFDLEGLL